MKTLIEIALKNILPERFKKRTIIHRTYKTTVLFTFSEEQRNLKSLEVEDIPFKSEILDSQKPCLLKFSSKSFIESDPDIFIDAEQYVLLPSKDKIIVSETVLRELLNLVEPLISVKECDNIKLDLVIREMLSRAEPNIID